MNKGLMIINLGSPDSTRVSDVRSYLREFLSDPDVIDLPALGRNLLLYGVILPFRPAKSAHAYRAIWTDNGSPLINHTKLLAQSLSEQLDFPVKMAMRYGSPSIESTLKEFRSQGVERIHAIALYPQYSTASMGSTYKELYRQNESLQDPLYISTEPAFYNDRGFLEAWAETIRPFLDQDFHVLFSYHGIPERQVLKSSYDGSCELGRCCDNQTPAFCYRAQCMSTTKSLTSMLNLSENRWEMTFQSRLGRTPWLKPYTDLRLVDLPSEGKKKVVMVSPSFVADCLETLEELNIRAREDFLSAGGEEFRFVPSLNQNPKWIQAVADMGRKGLANS
ncbi:MAG: ferrochelatase [Leptospiraceae bacterium]|nr:ferrochelatase [Leptospiraceae bacterium]